MVDQAAKSTITSSPAQTIKLKLIIAKNDLLKNQYNIITNCINTWQENCYPTHTESREMKLSISGINPYKCLEYLKWY